VPPGTANADPTTEPSPGNVIQGASAGTKPNGGTGIAAALPLQGPTGPTVGGLRSLPPICGAQPDPVPNGKTQVPKFGSQVPSQLSACGVSKRAWEGTSVDHV
jgi:hypothetical protein